MRKTLDQLASDKLTGWFKVNVWANLTATVKVVVAAVGLVAYYISGVNIDLPTPQFKLFGMSLELKFSAAASSLSDWSPKSIMFKVIFGGNATPQPTQSFPIVPRGTGNLPLYN